MITLTDLDAFQTAGIVSRYVTLTARAGGDVAWLRDGFPALPDTPVAEAP